MLDVGWRWWIVHDLKNFRKNWEENIKLLRVGQLRFISVHLLKEQNLSKSENPAPGIKGFNREIKYYKSCHSHSTWEI